MFFHDAHGTRPSFVKLSEDLHNSIRVLPGDLKIRQNIDPVSFGGSVQAQAKIDG